MKYILLVNDEIKLFNQNLEKSTQKKITNHK
jgi:hypothetical protein